jgi:hypothetical protein
MVPKCVVRIGVYYQPTEDQSCFQIYQTQTVSENNSNNSSNNHNNKQQSPTDEQL